MGEYMYNTKIRCSFSIIFLATNLCVEHGKRFTKFTHSNSTGSAFSCSSYKDNNDAKEEGNLTIKSLSEAMNYQDRTILEDWIKEMKSHSVKSPRSHKAIQMLKDREREEEEAAKKKGIPIRKKLEIKQVDGLLDCTANENSLDREIWDVTPFCSPRSVTPLHLACEKGRIDIITLLLDNGAHVNSSGKKATSPLHAACLLGHMDCVKLLIQRGAEIDNKDEKGRTPLHLASSAGHTDIAALLITSGAHVLVTDNKENSPLHLSSANNHLVTSEKLLLLGADIDCQNKGGDTPLHLACLNGSESVTILLLSYGAKEDIFNWDLKRAEELDIDMTPFHVLKKKASSLRDRRLSKGEIGVIKHRETVVGNDENNQFELEGNINLNDNDNNNTQNTESEINTLYWLKTDKVIDERAET